MNSIVKDKILIELVINNQCNKRCSYCDLDFKNKKFEKKDIDLFLEFLDTNSSGIEYFHINFFGGEPLLSYDEIVYFIEKNKISNSKYSINTNGVLLDKKKLDFFQKHQVDISLSLDNIDGFELLKTKDFSRYQDIIQVNCIHDPEHLSNSQMLIDSIVQAGFKKINFMPVFTTKTWSKENIVILGKLKKYISQFDVNVEYFGYYNGVSSEYQFMLDTDMYFYKDIDSLIWLQKQYSQLPNELKNTLEKKSKTYHLENDTFTIQDLINTYNKTQMVETILSIPQALGVYKDYLIIDRVLKDASK